MDDHLSLELKDFQDREFSDKIDKDNENCDAEMAYMPDIYLNLETKKVEDRNGLGFVCLFMSFTEKGEIKDENPEEIIQSVIKSNWDGKDLEVDYEKFKRNSIATQWDQNLYEKISLDKIQNVFDVAFSQPKWLESQDTYVVSNIMGDLNKMGYLPLTHLIPI